MNEEKFTRNERRCVGYASGRDGPYICRIPDVSRTSGDKSRMYIALLA